jgi:hypothetical protein
MNTNEREFKLRELNKKVIGVFYEVYNELGDTDSLNPSTISQWSLRSKQPD